MFRIVDASTSVLGANNVRLENTWCLHRILRAWWTNWYITSCSSLVLRAWTRLRTLWHSGSSYIWTIRSRSVPVIVRHSKIHRRHKPSCWSRIFKMRRWNRHCWIAYVHWYCVWQIWDRAVIAHIKSRSTRCCEHSLWPIDTYRHTLGYINGIRVSGFRDRYSQWYGKGAELRGR